MVRLDSQLHDHLQLPDSQDFPQLDPLRNLNPVQLPNPPRLQILPLRLQHLRAMLRLRVIQLQMESKLQEARSHLQLPNFLNFQMPHEILSHRQ